MTYHDIDKPAPNRGPSLVGQRIGMMIVIEETNKIGKIRAYKCICDCDPYTVKIKRATTLKQRGGAKSCGCLDRPIDLTGKIFGKWKVIKKTLDKKWECICTCYNKTKASITTGNLTHGKTKSCSVCAGLIDLTGLTLGNLYIVGLNEKIRDSKNHLIWDCDCSCGNSRIVRGYNLISGTTKYCEMCVKSRRKIYLKKKRLKPFDENGKRNSKDESGWVKSVLKRDNYTCQLSGESNCRFGVHHINNVASFPKLRFNINNGITITSTIHKLIHNLYGSKYTTAEQFEEFRNNYNLGKFTEVLNIYNDTGKWSEFITFRLQCEIKSEQKITTYRQKELFKFKVGMKFFFYINCILNRIIPLWHLK